VTLFDELVQNAVADGQAESGVGPSLERLPALTSEGAKGEVVGDDEEHEEEQGGDEADGVGGSELIGLELYRVEILKEVHPHTTAEMDGEAYGCVEDGKDACPDSNVAAQVEADGVGAAAKGVPGAEEQCRAEEEETAVCGGHAEAMADVRRRSGEIEECGAGGGEEGEEEVSVGALGPVSADERHRILFAMIAG